MFENYIQYDEQSSFIKLQGKDNYVTIHQQNLHILASEMYKLSKDLLSPPTRDILKLRSEQTYNLRQIFRFFTPRVNFVYHRTKGVSFLGPKIWGLIPNELKTMNNLSAFKKAIKKYSCRLCKIHVSNVGFVRKKS